MAIDQAICEVIRNGKDGSGPHILVIEAPPRHGKSELCSHWLPAWYLGRYPLRRVILTSYEASFARTWGRKARNTFAEHGPEMFGLLVSNDQSAANDWGIHGHDGGMVTAGAGGSITGRAADLLIVDDPIKNSEEAMSKTVRESIWDWWQTTAATRIQPGGCAIVIATRWHSEDLSGRLIAESESGEGPPVTRLTLPAIGGDGFALWPEQWPLKLLEKKRKGMDVFWWNALYQQKPSRQGRSEWPDSYFGDDIWFEDWPRTLAMKVLALDPSKGKSDKAGDYSALVKLGIGRDDCLYVQANMRRRPTPQLVSDAVAAWREWRPMAFGLETNAWQDLLAPLMIQEFRACGETTAEIWPINNTINKEVRIRRLGPFLANKRIKFKANCPDTRLLVEQLKDFPLGEHDDGPDALEMSIRLAEHLVGKQMNQVEEFVTA